MSFEACLNAGGAQLGKDILVVAPVLKTLKIAMKATADGLVPFPYDDRPTGPGQHHGACEPG